MLLIEFFHQGHGSLAQCLADRIKEDKDQIGMIAYKKIAVRSCDISN